MKDYPALQLAWPSGPDDDQTGELLAAIDDFAPTAAEWDGAVARIYFTTAADRDAADAVVAVQWPAIVRSRVAVPDDDWARRSQAALAPVDVGRFRVAPPWAAGSAADPARFEIIIQPSTGFGTGHHATTRLCLTLLEQYVRAGAITLDIGTGSGVLAIAASRLGADDALGIDNDPDALDNARENIALNGTRGVRVELVDAGRMLAGFAERFDVATANLTGALLCRTAPTVARTVRPGGVIIASGFQPPERAAVCRAFDAAGCHLLETVEEDDWLGAAFRRDG